MLKLFSAIISSCEKISMVERRLKIPGTPYVWGRMVKAFKRPTLVGAMGGGGIPRKSETQDGMDMGAGRISLRIYCRSPGIN